MALLAHREGPSGWGPPRGSPFSIIRKHGGHIQVAPGGSLVAVPAYALARSLVGPPDRDNLRISMTLTRLGTCTIPLLMLGLAFIWQARRAGFAPDRIAFGLAALL